VELILSLMPTEYKRWLGHLGNEELFQRYEDELILRLNNPKNLRDTRKRLDEFLGHLGGRQPSPEIAKVFLKRYANRKHRTRYRYTHMIKAFMRWYG